MIFVHLSRLRERYGQRPVSPEFNRFTMALMVVLCVRYAISDGFPLLAFWGVLWGWHRHYMHGYSPNPLLLLVSVYVGLCLIFSPPIATIVTLAVGILHECYEKIYLRSSPLLLLLVVSCYVVMGLWGGWMFCMLGGSLWHLLLVVWTFDTCSYMAGKRWGRLPILPRVSPKKTWEGFIAGIVCALILLKGVPLGAKILPPFFSILISFFIGDALQSALKRFLGYKDMSHTLGSHGGLSDRFDSLWGFFVLYAVFLLIQKTFMRMVL